MNIKEIIQQLRVTMDDAKGQDSHFDSWLTQNEGICKAIDALKILDTQPLPVQEPDRRALQAEGKHPAPCARHCEAKAFEIEIRSLKSALKQAQQVQEPVACRFCHSKKGSWTWQCYKCGEIDDVQKPAPPPVQPEPPKLRRGDTLRCIETDELCTVWSTSTTGKTLIKWSANNFGNYTAAQIGEVFWIEPREAEPVTWDKPSASFDDWWDSDRRRDNANPFQTDSFAYWAFEGWQAALAQRQWVGLTEFQFAEIYNKWNDSNGSTPWGLYHAIEKALKAKNHG